MLVIFDFDGTLADTWDWFAAELVLNARALHYRPVSREDAEALRSLDARALFQTLGVPLWRVPSLARFMRRKAEATAHRLGLFDGIPDLLLSLKKADLRLGVVSSNSEAAARTILGPELAGTIDVFDCGSAVFGKARKFKRVMRRTMAGAGDTIAVGDETRDLDAADEVGIRSIAVEWGFANPVVLRRAAPGRTVGDVADLAGRLLGDAPYRKPVRSNPSREPADAPRRG